MTSKHGVSLVEALTHVHGLLLFSCRCCSERLEGPKAFDGHLRQCAMARAGASLLNLLL